MDYCDVLKRLRIVTFPAIDGTKHQSFNAKDDKNVITLHLSNLEMFSDTLNLLTDEILKHTRSKEEGVS